MVRKGIDCEGIAQKEMDHFGNCPVCGAFVDMRDLAQVLAHIHGEKIPFFVDDEPPGLLPS
jgi:hypothetical protein